MKKFLSLALALVMCLSLVTISAGAKDFTDDSKIAYKEAVDVMSAVKVIDGYEDGSFNPNATLTRGAAAKIICNMILGPTTASALSADAAPFKDVPANHTFAGYIAYCAQQGIISGYADKSFRPAGTVTGYQFMKMLLGALGYDSDHEGFTGGNWSVNVAKLAISIGLDDGNDAFVGTKAMTREEACLYAYNTLKADMVKYDNNSSITVGDIVISNNSKAEVVTTNVAADGTKIHNEGSAPYVVQFGERYFKDLRLTVSASDDFERPAETWSLKSTEIGTYALTPDLTYTESVALGTIYRDLGLSANMTQETASVAGLSANEVIFFLDGSVRGAAAPYTAGLTKNDTTNKIGGNGVLTEVFYSDTLPSVIITMVNTYAGEVTAKHTATANKDAYVTVAPLTVGFGGTYETEESFNVDDVVTYNYSNKSGAVGVKNVAAAEQVTGVLNGYTASKSVTVNDVVYKSNDAYKGEITSVKLNNATKSDVKLALDQYGYVLDVNSDAAEGNYAVVLECTSTGGSYNKSKAAKLLLTDGTVKDVAVKEFYQADGTTTAVLTDEDTSNNGNGKISRGDIVSYRVDSKDEYKLTLLADVNVAAEKGAPKTLVTNGNYALNISNGNVAGSGTWAVNGGGITATGKTVFLIKNASGDYYAYTGIKNVPTVKTNSDNSTVVPTAVYCETGKIANVVYMDLKAGAGSTAAVSDNVLFVLGKGSVGASYNSDKGTYYTYDAILDGEITTVDLDSSVASFGIYTSVSFNDHQVGSVGSAGSTATGTVREKNGVVGIGATYLSAAKDCRVFYIDEDDNISNIGVAGIATDETDNVWYTVNSSGEVTTIVIQKQVSSAKDLLVAGTKYAVNGVAVATTGSNNAVTATTSELAGGEVITVLPDVSAGATVTSIAITGGTATGTLSGSSYTVAAGNADNGKTVIFTVTVVAENGTSSTGTITVTLTDAS